MELLLISENKIKISLTKADLDGYGISFGDIDYGNTETRRVFWTLFDEVKRKTGFDAAKSRLFVQVYPDTDGGCELYASRLQHSGNASEPRVNVFRGLKERISSERETALYRFDGATGLIAACKRLKALGYSGRASAYGGDGIELYLSLDGGDGTVPFIGEYGERCNSGGTELYVREHCRRICDGDAVSRLCEL